MVREFYVAAERRRVANYLHWASGAVQLLVCLLLIFLFQLLLDFGGGYLLAGLLMLVQLMIGNEVVGGLDGKYKTQPLLRVSPNSIHLGTQPMLIVNLLRVEPYSTSFGWLDALYRYFLGPNCSLRLHSRLSISIDLDLTLMRADDRMELYHLLEGLAQANQPPSGAAVSDKA